MTRKLNRLDQKKQFALNLLVQAEYAERKVTDVEFGKYATEKLGFEINRNNIAAAREVFDIPSTSRRHLALSWSNRLKGLRPRLLNWNVESTKSKNFCC